MTFAEALGSERIISKLTSRGMANCVCSGKLEVAMNGADLLCGCGYTFGREIDEIGGSPS